MTHPDEHPRSEHQHVPDVMSGLDSLMGAVVRQSNSDSWEAAVTEWAVVGLEADPSGSGVCACGQIGLVKLFTIQNQLNNSVLHPIGSSCIALFGSNDLEFQAKLLGSLLNLRDAIEAREDITMTKDYFTRAMLDSLYSDGAFPGDQWNNGDGERDFEFLLKMFNKRDKDAISGAQHRKIAVLLRNKIFPFIRNHPQLS